MRQQLFGFLGTRRGKIAGGVMALVGLCCMCGVCGLLFGERPAGRSVAEGGVDSETATFTPIPTVVELTTTPRVVATALPTEIPPTPTLIPVEPIVVATEEPTIEVEAMVEEIILPSVRAAEGVVNLRAGPSTDYEVVGSLAVGEELDVIGRNGAGSWLQVEGPAWVAASVVEVNGEVDGVEVVEVAPAPVVEPTVAPAATVPPVVVEATATPVPAAPTAAPAAVCSCSGNDFNCGDFNSHSAAQACFDHCVAEGRGDVHQLDQDNDGDACESLR